MRTCATAIPSIIVSCGAQVLVPFLNIVKLAQLDRERPGLLVRGNAHLGDTKMGVCRRV